ncbi:MAG: flagellar hook basal-body protein [Beijerinckiaceae bacterium]|nr:flagellar hook basal-body protein [Beijerinckiaceae bacterium]
MMRTSLTGLVGASRDLSVVSNNLANAKTVGFKRSVAQFTDVIGASPEARPGTEAGQGAMTTDIRRSTGQGTLTDTGGSLDLAIAGAGLFAFQQPTPEGVPEVSYSRAGRLTINASGDVVDGGGAQLLGFSLVGTGTSAMVNDQPKPLNVLSAVGGDASKIRNITIGANGVMTIATNTGTLVPVGAVAVASFTNETGLANAGGAKLKVTDHSGLATYHQPTRDGMGEIKQGAIEEANVDISAEMLRMIQAQQAYNGNARALQTGSEMLRSAVETLTRG